ncbi:MAG: ATP-binding protein [Defluviitaleaceae bacterium]|nr:ATP-binding protein [Defluviitaleaceae bacterium]
MSKKAANKRSKFIARLVLGISALVLLGFSTVFAIIFFFMRDMLYDEFYTVMMVLAVVFGVVFFAVTFFIFYLIKVLNTQQTADEKYRIDMAREQAASRAKSLFLSNMSHEIRTPMNAIMSMAHFAKAADEPDKKDVYIEKVETASGHLLGIINQVLDMSQIEADKFYLTAKPFHLKEMLDGIIGAAGAAIAAKEIWLSVNIDKDIPVKVVADERRLSQVVTNLLSNAIKFTPYGGIVRLNVRIVSERNLRFEISDTGIGIPKDEQERMFDAFEQSEEGRNIGGTGLGLAICKKIVTMMGGGIWVDSQSGKGATFTFIIPVEIPEDSSEESGENKHNTYGTGCFKDYTFLLAEDIEINREIIMTILDDSGAEIVCAEDGAQALRIFEAEPERFDLIFMDLQMPVMDGLTTTRRIREINTEVPIIAMTANVFPEDIDTCLAAGMNDHLGKPLQLDEVFEKIGKCLPTDGGNSTNGSGYLSNGDPHLPTTP